MVSEARGEVSVAVLALDSGDLAHAADHVADALNTEPALPEAHEVLAQLAVAAGGVEAALGLYPMERPYAGSMAARAHLLAAAGQWDEAVSLLAQLAAFEPSLPWARVPWLGCDGLAEALSGETVLYGLITLNRALPEPVPEELRDPLGPLFALLCAAVERQAEDNRLLALGSALARRFTAFDRAESWAVRAHRRDPDRLSSVMLGHVYRSIGRADDAIAVWSDYLRRDPSDVYLHVDLAELYADTGRLELGLPWLEEVSAKSPAHEKAAPALLGLRYRMDRDPRHLLALADHLRDHPDHHYAGDLLARFSWDTPWLGHVDGATESLVNLLHQILAEQPEHRDLSFEGTVSGVEPPSAMMTLLSVLPRAELTVSDAGHPDPRLPSPEWNPSGVAVWRYPGDAMIAERTVPAPARESAETVRRTTQLRWPHLPAAYDHAVALSDVPLPDLIATLVHPPAPADDETRAFTARYPDMWVRAVQVAASLGIAHHRVAEPWYESTRRTVLFDLLRGPEDWVCEAAALALIAVAWTHPDTRDDIGMAICRRMLDLGEAARTRPVTILSSFCRLTLACPWLDDPFLSLARDILANNEQD
ncbi:tetratricopeptide repeat protein [Nocardia concava]|uniref:tetratricopeptide repeat protein n=1 Tax=Nocardia concava TaxID=257281 RepID=UPI0002DA2C5D|nr:tetratricopeptide repeat protein [Nocardia concava]